MVAWTVLMPIADKLLSFIPDPAAREAARAEMMREERQHELQLVSTQTSTIIAEAQSDDPWTSRARPTFLYVMYIMILSSIPMGVLFAISPETAGAVVTGVTGWLKAIPTELYTLMGVGYVGYVGARSYDKKGGR